MSPYERMTRDELIERLSRLEARFAERTALADRRAAQLRLLAGQLTQAEQRERRRLAQLLHDHLQQLLVAGKMQVGMLLDDLPAGAAADVLGQVNQLLDESITASRSLTVELSPPILHDGGLAAALHWLARRMEERHGLIVQVEADPQAEPADEDVRALVFDITRELLFNVSKHAGVDLAHVTLSREPSDGLQIVVADAGVGFDPALPRPVQLDGGFGLTSARERLEFIGGSIRIHSNPGFGTEIRLRAPLHAAEPAAVRQAITPPLSARRLPAAASSAASNESGIRVLIVDDHKLVREGLVGLLQRTTDIEIVGEASNGQMAADLARELHPDVVVMDVNMPLMNGIAATRRIREELPDVRVIGLSLHEESDMAAAMLAAGADAYVTKGGRTEELIDAIRGACRVGGAA